MLGVSSSPVVLFLAVVWTMISVFLTFWGPQPLRVCQVTLGGPGVGGRRSACAPGGLGDHGVGVWIPPTGHLQFGSLFHPLHLHHP